MKRILVIGATGLIGRPVAMQLKKDGYQVRVLAREIDKAHLLFDDSFEFVQGDVLMPETISKALENCDGVHISLKGGPTPQSYDQIEHQGTAIVANLSQKAGIDQLTFLSGASTSKENSWFYVPKAKYDAEKAIQESGVDFTIFRASWFMESIPLFIKGSKIIKFGKQISPVHWIAAADFAEMVSKSFSKSEAKNKILYIYGSEKVPLSEAFQTYCATVRPDLQISTMPIWFMKIIAAVSRNAELKDVANLMDYYEEISENADPSETLELFGKPRITLNDWCESQKKAHKEKMSAFTV
jgi:uncharacterized protein YbjT (DUF2867 family)